MKKKLFTAIILAILFSTLSINYATANQSLNIEIDDHIIDFEGAKPYIDDNSGRTMVPVRFVTEAMFTEVQWDGDKRMVSLNRFDKHIEMFIDKKSYRVKSDDDIYTINQMDQAPIIVNSRTFVPLRFVTESFGGDITWDGETRTVSIETKFYDPTKEMRTNQYSNNDDFDSLEDISEPLFKGLNKIHDARWIQIGDKEYKFIPLEFAKGADLTAHKNNRTRVYIAGHVIDREGNIIEANGEKITIGNGYSVSLGNDSFEISTASGHISAQFGPVIEALFRKYIYENITKSNEVVRISGVSDVLENDHNYKKLMYNNYTVEVEIDSDQNVIYLQGKDILQFNQ